MTQKMKSFTRISIKQSTGNDKFESSENLHDKVVKLGNLKGNKIYGNQIYDAEMI